MLLGDDYLYQMWHFLNIGNIFFQKTKQNVSESKKDVIIFSHDSTIVKIPVEYMYGTKGLTTFENK